MTRSWHDGGDLAPRYGPAVMVDDPWGYGNSLEWATSCPPPRHNFTALPRIRSERPAFELHYPHMIPRMREEAHVMSAFGGHGTAAPLRTHCQPLRIRRNQQKRSQIPITGRHHERRIPVASDEHSLTQRTGGGVPLQDHYISGAHGSYPPLVRVGSKLLLANASRPWITSPAVWASPV